MNSAFEIIIIIIIIISGTEICAKDVYMCYHLRNYSVSQKPILRLLIF